MFGFKPSIQSTAAGRDPGEALAESDVLIPRENERYEEIIDVFVMGRRGAGKTQFINRLRHTLGLTQDQWRNRAEKRLSPQQIAHADAIQKGSIQDSSLMLTRRAGHSPWEWMPKLPGPPVSNSSGLVKVSAASGGAGALASVIAVGVAAWLHLLGWWALLLVLLPIASAVAPRFVRPEPPKERRRYLLEIFDIPGETLEQRKQFFEAYMSKLKVLRAQSVKQGKARRARTVLAVVWDPRTDPDRDSDATDILNAACFLRDREAPPLLVVSRARLIEQGIDEISRAQAAQPSSGAHEDRRAGLGARRRAAPHAEAPADWREVVSLNRKLLERTTPADATAVGTESSEGELEYLVSREHLQALNDNPLEYLGRKCSDVRDWLLVKYDADPDAIVESVNAGTNPEHTRTYEKLSSKVKAAWKAAVELALARGKPILVYTYVEKLNFLPKREVLQRWLIPEGIGVLPSDEPIAALEMADLEAVREQMRKDYPSLHATDPSDKGGGIHGQSGEPSTGNPGTPPTSGQPEAPPVPEGARKSGENERLRFE